MGVRLQSTTNGHEVAGIPRAEVFGVAAGVYGDNLGNLSGCVPISSTEMPRIGAGAGETADSMEDLDDSAPMNR